VEETEALYPILIQWGSWTVRSYGVLVATAVMVGYFVARREVVRANIITSEVFERFFLWTMVGGFVGARVYYILFSDLTYFLAHPAEIPAIWHGGLALHGGLIGGLVAGILFVRRYGLPFWRLADILAPAIILGQAVGRLACLFNGDAFGKPSNLPWAIIFTNEAAPAPLGVPLHPTQLYEFLWDLLVFTLIWRLRNRRLREGRLFLTYAALYSVGRALIEPFRGDQLTVTLFHTPLPIAVLTSLLVLGLSVALLWRSSLEGARNE
jgi:phosphatidylglycerol:prolipoprotein diacylglycerol transferase